ncbi:coat protein [Botrytis virus X]|uniref:Capsid protein n=1 Tax=Botrytis virus X (isolate Botrytis cinerea/New Zealand/Howitt/2006) TaxID=686947 RepID=CAPSD_BOTVX|nr:coat protein [Botrytis virus X]Q6YNQ5.1 RecName: Full=Capsid protein; Short=CP [Botrytis virus X NZL/Howitt]AAL17724.1 coat protein [Botrytis virus X]
MDPNLDQDTLPTHEEIDNDVDSAEEEPPEPPLLPDDIDDDDSHGSRTRRQVKPPPELLRAVGACLISGHYDGGNYFRWQQSIAALYAKAGYAGDIRFHQAAIQEYALDPVLPAPRVSYDLLVAHAGLRYQALLNEQLRTGKTPPADEALKDAVRKAAQAAYDNAVKTGDYTPLIDIAFKGVDINKHASDVAQLAKMSVTMDGTHIKFTAGEMPKDKVITSNSMASPNTVMNILNLITTSANVTAVTCGIEFAIACAHQGSSRYTRHTGTSTGGSTFELIAAHVKEHCTIRQFCSYFAKVVWNHLLTHATPPVNWAKHGFTLDSRYAAFDFFDAVTNAAALPPKNGLIRAPTSEEIRAHNLNAHLLINASRQDDQVSSSAQYTAAIAQAGGFKRPQIGWGE